MFARVAQGKGELSVRELARSVGRDVKRVHEDVGILTTLGLL
jgi:predicted transcriptional regulator